MGIIGKLLHKLPHKVIGGECSQQLGPLLTRYFILRNKRLGIYIHHLHHSDVRTMHDHPWDFLSIILKGEYIEHTPYHNYNYIPLGLEKVKLYKRFSILKRPAEWIHRLEMDKPCWTLVIRFKRKKSWGFFTPQGFVNEKKCRG